MIATMLTGILLLGLAVLAGGLLAPRAGNWHAGRHLALTRFVSGAMRNARHRAGGAGVCPQCHRVVTCGAGGALVAAQRRCAVVLVDQGAGRGDGDLCGAAPGCDRIARAFAAGACAPAAIVSLGICARRCGCRASRAGDADADCPGFATYPLRLHHPGARLLFANSVSLLPGTLAVDLRDDCLAIHALDRDSDFTAELRRVESAVGRVFGEAL